MQVKIRTFFRNKDSSKIL